MFSINKLKRTHDEALFSAIGTVCLYTTFSIVGIIVLGVLGAFGVSWLAKEGSTLIYEKFEEQILDKLGKWKHDGIFSFSIFDE